MNLHPEGFNGALQTRIEKIELTQAQQRFEIAADTVPLDVVIDPNTQILMQLTIKSGV